jgi:hypothetical protein
MKVLPEPLPRRRRRGYGELRRCRQRRRRFRSCFVHSKSSCFLLRFVRPASFYQIAHKAEVDAFQIVEAFQIVKFLNYVRYSRDQLSPWRETSPLFGARADAARLCCFEMQKRTHDIDMGWTANEIICSSNFFSVLMQAETQQITPYVPLQTLEILSDDEELYRKSGHLGLF